MSVLGQVMGPERARMQLAHLQMICQGLLFRIVQQSRENKDRGFLVLLTSPTAGSGVSQITSALVHSLNTNGREFAISVDYRHLNHDQYDLTEPVDIVRRETFASLWQSETSRSPLGNWQGIQENLVTSFRNLRNKYRYVLVDCPSLKESQDAIRLAPLVDGVILVVEANRTQKDQLLYAEKTIESANGRILGHVLNKRTYVIPDWLSNKMEAIGI